MMHWLSQHWLLLTFLLATLGFVLRKVFEVRKKRKQFEEWAKQQRFQREREEKEEEERKRKARELAEASLCKTTEQLEQAIQKQMSLITIEGSLARSYVPGSAGLASLGDSYQVSLVRHGKVVLKRA